MTLQFSLFFSPSLLSSLCFLSIPLCYVQAVLYLCCCSFARNYKDLKPCVVVQLSKGAKGCHQVAIHLLYNDILLDNQKLTKKLPQQQ